jgi:hypothetical protein
VRATNAAKRKEKKTTEHTERRRKDTEKELVSVYSVPFSVCSVVFFSSPQEVIEMNKNAAPSRERLQAWWSHRQGLDGSLRDKSSAEVLAQAGWARSVGGVGPYLTLFARNGASRESVDAAAAQLEIHELPSARGWTYVLPASDFPLGLRASQGASNEAEMRIARKLGVTDDEVAKLSAAIVKALAKGPLEPEELRKATGDASRNLGDEGKKKGMITTLPLSLGLLQTAGDIRRIPTNGRLDQQRYRYALWRPNPIGKSNALDEEVHRELARRFFKWIAPATLAEFQAFAGIGVKAAKAAVEPLGLVAISEGDERLISPDQKPAFDSFKPPKDAQYSLVSCIDSMLLLRRKPVDLLVPEDMKRKVYGEKGLLEAGTIADLPSHAILDRGRVVGLWEFDPAREAIAWSSFGVKDRKLDEAVARTERYVKEQLGDARSFSLDSPKSRAPRIEALRKSA